MTFVTADSRPPNKYQDGDVVCCFNARRISAAHVSGICHHRHAPLTGDGLRADGIAQQFQELTYQYKFQRVSRAEIKRITLATMDEEILGPTPNAKGEYIDVQAFIDRRKEHLLHRIFGATGAEYWYGGRESRDPATLDLAWQLIEADTPLRKADHLRWPLSPLEKRHFLGLPIEDVSDRVMQNAVNIEIDYDMYQPEYDPRGERGPRVGDTTIRKRRVNIPWRTLGLAARDVLDLGVEVDVRESRAPDVLDTLATVKPRINVWSVTDHLDTRPLLREPTAAPVVIR